MSALGLLGALVGITGAALVALAGLGLHRFDDADVRLHVAAKASSAGLLLLLVGLGLRAPALAVGLELALTGLFVVLTVPIATHALARARFRDGPDRTTTRTGGPRG